MQKSKKEQFPIRRNMCRMEKNIVEEKKMKKKETKYLFPVRE